jgi:hypothetical protein
VAPICGSPAESHTTPETDPWEAPFAGAFPTTISNAKKTKWSLRIVTVDDLAASLAILFKIQPTRLSRSCVR